MSTMPRPLSSSTASPFINQAVNEAGYRDVIDLVDDFVAATPDALAIQDNLETLTYRELALRANQLARYLISVGVERDVVVGICLERSIDMVISALATLKAGGAYLPLDPAYPSKRLRLMIDDAQPRVILTRSDLSKELSQTQSVNVDLDLQANIIEGFETDAPQVLTSRKDLAYVIYTSGSTGEPKGVQVTRGNLMNLVRWHQRAFAVAPADRASVVASIGFDASVWETWPYLTAGASLHIASNEIRTAPEALRDWLISNRITIGFLPTILAEQALGLSWPADASLRFLLTGADTLRRFPPAGLPFTLINNYGPTECTVVATSGVVPSGVSRDSLPTIGTAIDNTRVYLLDEQLQQTRFGATGEIYIGGASVARGYLNQPELTAERFIRDPFREDPNARLYRTGDLGRRLGNGEIAYMGRVDDQIKIMGYRIEPNEIVAVLDSHPHVRTSVVVARDVTCSEKQLTAYVVAESGTQLQAEDLREFLTSRLPDYMVPPVFVQLALLPLNESGKIDRKALPAPDATNTLWEHSFIAPRTPLEERLAAMLSSLLGIDEVSINDNFFLLGGHSLLGTQLIGQIRGGFAVDLTLRSLFEAPTIAELAMEIEELLRARINAMSAAEVEGLLA